MIIFCHGLKSVTIYRNQCLKFVTLFKPWQFFFTVWKAWQFILINFWNLSRFSKRDNFLSQFEKRDILSLGFTTNCHAFKTVTIYKTVTIFKVSVCHVLKSPSGCFGTRHSCFRLMHSSVSMMHLRASIWYYFFGDACDALSASDNDHPETLVHPAHTMPKALDDSI